MDSSSVQSGPSIEVDEWGGPIGYMINKIVNRGSAVHRPCQKRKKEKEKDTDGFVIPSLTVGESGLSEVDVPDALGLKPTSTKVIKEEERIYLGPHGAPPSQAKQQQELNAAGRKQRYKYKLKEADRKFTGTGRENKVENLRELVGGGKASIATMPKGSPRDWLDPHCNESQFERYSQ